MEALTLLFVTLRIRKDLQNTLMISKKNYQQMDKYCRINDD